MRKSPLIILGSARRNSDTEKFVHKVFKEPEYSLVDLLDFEIAPYNYEGSYPETDDFYRIIETILAHRVIVFATPVYWYSMSAIMKNFFDRLTDLVTVKKEYGRKLKGKKVFLIAVGADPALPDGFQVPFQLTAAYLGMDFQANIYHSVKAVDPEEEALQLKTFTSQIAAAL
ncbi:MAG TPA: NAD(P)H-dependent oxidoreductase [Adhaeribacter sp.]|nr:NAD(P)H-dependent oxidoreductase [Adhaeribacter sp.]